MQSSILSFRVEEVQEEWYIDFNCTRKKETKNQKEKRKNDATGIPVCCLFFKKKSIFSLLCFPCMYLPLSQYESPFTQSRHESTVLSL
jgi:hypothetical protein